MAKRRDKMTRATDRAFASVGQRNNARIAHVGGQTTVDARRVGGKRGKIESTNEARDRLRGRRGVRARARMQRIINAESQRIQTWMNGNQPNNGSPSNSP